jgi:hypothetical protein
MNARIDKHNISAYGHQSKKKRGTLRQPAWTTWLALAEENASASIQRASLPPPPQN